ncbi:hypothetical protein Ddye_001622 [Dipteronia dyeriana]|uniref:DUF1985 domain-containing protein n=1 Tax=Dipteronia dyeriana TaxID=168575 RepID=A0AAD9XPJ0_9ROSI|nr:hypothetical protein Ddye_001622 [Dipteronia dyeriana]
MGGNKLLESLKIKECDRFPSRVTGHCNWESIRLIKSHLTEKQLKLFRVTCFGHFLDVSDMVLSGHFCRHILLRECHVKNTDYNASSVWYHVGNGLIRFSLVEFFLVSGLAFGEYSKSNLEFFKRKNSRLRRIYFQSSKVKVKMIVDWFRNLGHNNKISDDEDVVKLALLLFLEMTLVGKDDRTSILYWALELVDDLDAFNKFPWGTFIYSRKFNSLSTKAYPSERVIKVYDSKPDAYNVDQILKWATCLRKMVPSLLVHAMPDTYTDPSSFTVDRPKEGVPCQGNQSDCEVFTLKFLEYLWARKQFDFDENNGQPFRVKIATEIFQNSKEIPCVNNEPLRVNNAT